MIIQFQWMIEITISRPFDYHRHGHEKSSNECMSECNHKLVVKCSLAPSAQPIDTLPHSQISSAHPMKRGSGIFCSILWCGCLECGKL